MLKRPDLEGPPRFFEPPLLPARLDVARFSGGLDDDGSPAGTGTVVGGSEDDSDEVDSGPGPPDVAGRVSKKAGSDAAGSERRHASQQRRPLQAT